MSNYYTFTSSEGSSVTVLRGADPPTMTGGGGGWSIESRPKRVGLTIWNGRDPYQMDISVLFDGWGRGRSQEDAIAILNQMQMGADLEEPPTVTIDGSIPVKGTDVKWVISSIDWGTNVIWHSDTDFDLQYRLRQDAVIHLIQYNPEDALKVSGGGNLRAPRRYVVKASDDLRSIAQSMYGDPSRWKDIQKANNLRDPKALSGLVGKEIRVPA